MTELPGTPGHHGGHADDHAGPTGASEESVRMGHEPDDILLRPFVYIGVGFIVFATFVHLFVWGLFSALRTGPAEEVPHPMAVARNEQPVNERLEDINGKMRQPRLEGLRRFEAHPAYYRSSAETPKGNSPEYHPEDILPNRWVDPATGQVPLRQYQWASEANGVARIPIDQALAAAARMKNYLPVQKGRENASPDGAPSQDRPKMSNSGRGAVGAGVGKEGVP